MSWFLLVLTLNLTFNGFFSEASHEKKLLTPVVVGTVYCDTCFQHDFSRNSHFIAGASVAVECKNGDSKQGFWKEVRTNEHGEFRIELPFTVTKRVRRIKGCTVKLVKSSEPHCSVASAATSSSLSLKARNQREHTFSAGFFSFKPNQQLDLCNHNPSSVKNSKEFDSIKTGLPPNLLPPGLPTLPPVPEVPELPPLPQLPALPPVPIIGIPLPPIAEHAQDTKKPQSSDQKIAHPDFFFPPIPFLPPPLIPNPLQPPPLIPNPFQPPPLIPNPFQPPPAPLIPNPFQPPPAPLIPNPFQPPPASPAPLIPNPFQPPPASPAPLIPNPFQPPPASPAPLIPNPFRPPPTPSNPPPLLPLPPSPLLPIPPIPGFTPSPPPPPPPASILPFPFPPLFPPRSPGNPPASSSKATSP